MTQTKGVAASMTPEERDLVKRLRDEPCSVIEREAADRIEALERELADHKEVIADKRRLAREINKALDGADSESLCDAVSVAQKQASELSTLRKRLKEIADLADYYINGDEDAHGTIVRIAALTESPTP